MGNRRGRAGDAVETHCMRLFIASGKGTEGRRSREAGAGNKRRDVVSGVAWTSFACPCGI